MERQVKLRTKQILAVLGLSCVWTTAGFTQSAGPGGLNGNLTAYQFDGVYKGSSQPVASNDETCSAGQNVAFEVRQARFKLAWNDRQAFDAKITRAGTFYATTGSATQAEKHMIALPTLQGHVSSGDLVAEYGTRWCRYRLEATQSPAAQHFSERSGGTSTGQ